VAKRCVFVLLLGDAETGDVDHFQLLQQRTALEEGNRLGFDVEVVPAPAFDQFRILKRRLLDGEAPPLAAVVTEPGSTSALELMMNELRGKVGLIILSAWGPAFERAATTWGPGLPIGAVGTNHIQVGEIQARQVRLLLPERGRVLYVAGPLRSLAAQQRLEGLKKELGPDIPLMETSAGRWIVADGAVAFNDWYRVAKARDPVVHVVAAGSDELAMGAREACEALAQPQHREALLTAKFLGVDACPTYGAKLVAEGQLAGSVLTPANTGLALAHLQRFFDEGVPVPALSFTEAQPFSR